MQNIESWFENHVQKFRSSDKGYTQNIELKKDHTFRVCEEITRLGKSLDLSMNDLRLAKTIALLHDVGRFEQYDRYRTFADYKSEDHAQLGIKVINQENVLKGIDPSTKRVIICAISYHNRAHLPINESERCLFFAKLLRDADKLDILYVVTEYYQNSVQHSNQSLELELPDTPHISDEVYQKLISGKIVSSQHVQSLNDFKLLQMAWVYDVNFLITYRLIKERKYLEKIRDSFPKSERVKKAFAKVQSYLDSKA
ncbi:MAG: HD domain-containing protein [Candidatus Aminicenantes bacterium]|nr:HD domain-containing protein [Candidatus Aminicenantes bacterium]